MKYITAMRIRTGRLLVVGCAIVIYVLLVVGDGMRTFPYRAAHPALMVLLQFSFSTLTSLMFLAVGVLVWLYARDRKVAVLLLGFSCAMVDVFAVQTGALMGDRVLIILSTCGSFLTISLLDLLLLFFPRTYFSDVEQAADRQRPGSRTLRRLGLSCVRVYIGCLLLCSLSLLGCFLYFLFLQLPRPGWLLAGSFLYTLLGLGSAMLTAIIAYVRSSSLRERQQLRLFVSGVVLALAPFVLLTVLPAVLRLTPSYVVPPQLSTLSFIIFPLSLGYSVLRYQVLVFDVYIRRAALWIVGGVCLVLFGYCMTTVTSLLWVGTPRWYCVFVTGMTALLAPLVWWLAKVLTDRLFFSEVLHYRRLMEIPMRQADKTLDLDEVAQLLMQALVQAFETLEVCLFVLEEESGYYRLCLGIGSQASDTPRRRLADFLLRSFAPGHAEPRDWFAVDHPLVVQVNAAPRPLLASEIVALHTRADANVNAKAHTSGLHRYLKTAGSAEENVLIAPIHVQGRMIGMLMVGERGDHAPYAGPDFEVVALVLARFASLLETARLYRKAGQHAALLQKLYATNLLHNDVFQSLRDVASSYTAIVAEAVTAAAELWLYDEGEKSLRCIAACGAGEQLLESDSVAPVLETDWVPKFCERMDEDQGQESAYPLAICFPHMVGFPFAWLPLNKGKKHLGVLILAYQQPHVFAKEERRVLEMFANHCAVALENARITLALRAAYERQKELDVLKDQFISTASHELRTPLAAVQGYIAMLERYGEKLADEERQLSIRKVRRGCDELILLVENITDASHGRGAVQNVKPQRVRLIEPVQDVLEIVGALLKSEQRAVSVAIAPALLVLADSLRVRQVLLNLLDNARKYSPAATPIEITARVEGGSVIVAVRDYGLGVPPADQLRLFERFVRLERDLSSPIRGAGLGLAICKQLVEAMGGRMWVESSGRPGEGSAFLFSLPYIDS